MSGLPFHFEVPISFFEKADAPPGQQRRIGGVITTENPDRQGEVVLQKGLDFKDFLQNGWLNDDHSKATGDGAVVGYPAGVQFFKKGDSLPNGAQAPANAHWVEGYLLDDWEPANKIWKLGKALQKTDRRLGFSVEGKIHRRIGPKTVFKKSAQGDGKWVGNTIAKATVRNVAVTSCPVNTDSSLEILTKSLLVAEQTGPTELEARIATLEKAMTVGAPSSDSPEGPRTGEGAAAVHAKESLESDDDPRFRKKKKGKDQTDDESDETNKSLTYGEAATWILRKCPDFTPAEVGRFLTLTRALKSQGRL